MTKPGFGNAKISRKFRLRNRFQTENLDVWMFGCSNAYAVHIMDSIGLTALPQTDPIDTQNFTIAICPIGYLF